MFPIFWSASPVKLPVVLVKRTCRMSAGALVLIPTNPPDSKIAEFPTSALFTYLASTFGVPARTTSALAFDCALPDCAVPVAVDGTPFPIVVVPPCPVAAPGASRYAEAGRPPSVSASAARNA